MTQVFQHGYLHTICNESILWPVLYICIGHSVWLYVKFWYFVSFPWCQTPGVLINGDENSTLFLAKLSCWFILCAVVHILLLLATPSQNMCFLFHTQSWPSPSKSDQTVRETICLYPDGWFAAGHQCLLRDTHGLDSIWCALCSLHSILCASQRSKSQPDWFMFGGEGKDAKPIAMTFILTD